MSEQLIINAIRAAFPRDSILAEESGRTDVVAAEATCKAPSGRPAGAADRPRSTSRAWIIDPLDGTVNYANGIPCFCVCVGLAVGGTPDDRRRLRPDARRDVHRPGRRAARKLDGMPIRHPRKEKLLGLRRVAVAAAARLGATARSSLRRAIRVSRNMGSAALALAYLANGRFDAFVQAGGLSLWDICAAGLIAVEGGVRLTTLDGGPWFDMARPTKTIALLGASAASSPDLTARDARLSGWRQYERFTDRITRLAGTFSSGPSCTASGSGAAREIIVYLPPSLAPDGPGWTDGRALSRRCTSTTARTSSTSAPPTQASGMPTRRSSRWPGRGSKPSQSACRTVTRGMDEYSPWTGD